MGCHLRSLNIVIPSVQPTHATSDMGYAELRIGPERIKGAYAYQTLLQYELTILIVYSLLIM